MLGFLRRLRRSLIEEGNLRKYLVYAVGEILLVVLGILIALQINNLNEDRKDRIEEEKALKALKIDFVETRRRLNATIKQQEAVIHKGRKLINLFADNDRTAYTDSIGHYLNGGALSFWRAEPITGTYDALIGAGNLGLIQNEDLRRLLAEYSAEITSGFEDHEYSMNLLAQLFDKSSEFIAPLLPVAFRRGIKLNDDERSKNNAIDGLLNETSFVGPLIWKNLLDHGRIERQKAMLTYTNDIIELIDSELSKD